MDSYKFLLLTVVIELILLHSAKFSMATNYLSIGEISQHLRLLISALSIIKKEDSLGPHCVYLRTDPTHIVACHIILVLVCKLSQRSPLFKALT
jgi:hypothetical protein